MKITRKGWNGVVDAVLTAGFVTTFFVDLTGLSLHQWLGLLLLFLVACHVMLHRSWCRAAAGKAFRKLPLRMRTYCLIDAALLASLLISLVAGLVISTWLNLVLLNDPFWRDLHIDSSYATLLLASVKLVVKFGYNRRRVKRRMPGLWGTSGGFEATPQGLTATPMLATQPLRMGSPMTRRRALATVAVAGMAVLAPLHGLWSGKDLLEASLPKEQQSSNAPPPETLPQADLQAYSESTRPAGRREPPESVTTERAGTSIEPPVIPASPIPEVVFTAPPPASREVAHAEKAVANENACSVQCSRQCVWPEGCRRYVDANGNGRCDLGECQ